MGCPSNFWTRHAQTCWKRGTPTRLISPPMKPSMHATIGCLQLMMTRERAWPLGNAPTIPVPGCPPSNNMINQPALIIIKAPNGGSFPCRPPAPAPTRCICGVHAAHTLLLVYAPRAAAVHMYRGGTAAGQTQTPGGSMPSMCECAQLTSKGVSVLSSRACWQVQVTLHSHKHMQPRYIGHIIKQPGCACKQGVQVMCAGQFIAHTTYFCIERQSSRIQSDHSKAASEQVRRAQPRSSRGRCAHQYLTSLRAGWPPMAGLTPMLYASPAGPPPFEQPHS